MTSADGASRPPAALRIFDRATEIFAMALVVALLGVVTLGVVSRALNEPFIWTDELSRFLMVWLACIGWLLASRRRAHIRVRYFHDLLPARWWHVAEIGMQAAVTLLGALIAWFSIGLVARNSDLEATTLPLSMAWMYVPMILAGIVTALQGAADLGREVLTARAGPLGPDRGPVE